MDNQLGQIFVQCDSDLMLARRIKRDVAERGRDVNGILEQSVPFRPYYIRRFLSTWADTYDMSSRRMTTSLALRPGTQT